MIFTEKERLAEREWESHAGRKVQIGVLLDEILCVQQVSKLYETVSICINKNTEDALGINRKY